MQKLYEKVTWKKPLSKIKAGNMYRIKAYNHQRRYHRQDHHNTKENSLLFFYFRRKNRDFICDLWIHCTFLFIYINASFLLHKKEENKKKKKTVNFFVAFAKKKNGNEWIIKNMFGRRVLCHVIILLLDFTRKFETTTFLFCFLLSFCYCSMKFDIPLTPAWHVVVHIFKI